MAADQCRLDSTANWWDHDHLHAAAAAAGAGSHLSSSSWPWQRQQQQANPNSNSSCDEDVSMSSTSFTNASNHSSLSVDSSRRRVDQRSASSHDDLNNIGEQVSDNQIWSQVLLNNGLNSGMTHHVVGENFLDALSSKNLSNTAMYEPACDYLKKLDNASSNWEFTNTSTTAATMHASNLNNFERQININGSFSNENLSNLVSTWSIAPPEPQLVSGPFFNLPHQVSCYGAHNNNLMKVDALTGANIHGIRPFSSENGSNVDYQIGLNNAMAADNSYYGSGNGLVMPDSYSSSNSARSFTDIISFNSRLGKPLMDHTHHAQKPSNFKSLINSESTSKKQSVQTSSPTKMSGRGQGTANESAGKKKRTEESSTSSETVLKKPKQETSAVNSAASVKMQAPKVKVADKITALQQIVSPFGKTDTASVLYEAIQYIKFLQDQVHVLSSSPYLKTNPHKQDPWGKFDQVRGDHHAKMDLKSRGLCLVPTSCTPQVYRENTGSDYWTPTYRGCLYR